jgi:hypothetical protein
LPTTIGRHVPRAGLDEIDCAFRDGLHAPAGPSRGWAYLDDPAAIAESVELCAEEWRLQGHAFFDRYAAWPDGAEALLADRRPSRTLMVDARAYELIAEELRR